jgi:alpha-ketoglutarate-dependent taurine dioxygenase
MHLINSTVYETWRDKKLAAYPRSISEIRVDVANLARPTPSEHGAILDACRRCGMAVYASTAPAATARGDLQRFAAQFGLGHVEAHRSADDDGIVAIEVTEEQGKKGFIPYTNKSLNWHTDGYYNPPADAIRGMILHCIRPAEAGGENALLDPEIVYIRVRDKSPRLLAALEHHEAMTIPESIEEDGRIRPTSVGPVFFLDQTTNRPVMRYTARARNVIWRDDPDTREAKAYLESLLAGAEEPLILSHRLAAGEGLISNNVLHTRTAFESGKAAARLLLRGRYRDRIAGT